MDENFLIVNQGLSAQNYETFKAISEAAENNTGTNLAERKVRGQRRIRWRFQVSYFTTRLDAKTAHISIPPEGNREIGSLATEGFDQRSMVVRGPHQIGKLLFTDPLGRYAKRQPGVPAAGLKRSTV